MPFFASQMKRTLSLSIFDRCCTIIRYFKVSAMTMNNFLLLLKTALWLKEKPIFSSSFFSILPSHITIEYKKTAAGMYKTVNYVNKVDWTTSCVIFSQAYSLQNLWNSKNVFGNGNKISVNFHFSRLLTWSSGNSHVNVIKID